MFDWQRDLVKIWELFFEELPLALAQIADDLSTGLLDTVEEFTEVVAEELEIIGNDIKELQNEWWGESWLQDLLEESPDRPLEEDEPFNHPPALEEEWPVYYEPKRPATPSHQPVCMGCRNYNGTTFGGNLLVCGIHPYGCQGESCPDWEAE